MLDWAFSGSFLAEETKLMEETHHYEAKVLSWNENEYFSEMWMKKSWGNRWCALKRTWREAELMANFSKVSLLIRVESKRIYETKHKFSFNCVFHLVSGCVLLPREFWWQKWGSACTNGNYLFLKWLKYQLPDSPCITRIHTCLMCWSLGSLPCEHRRSCLEENHTFL